MAKSERLEMRVDTDFLALVDDWRRQQPDIPPRAEAIRRLVEAGLVSGQRNVEADKLVSAFQALPPAYQQAFKEWMIENGAKTTTKADVKKIAARGAAIEAASAKGR